MFKYEWELSISKNNFKEQDGLIIEIRNLYDEILICGISRDHVEDIHVRMVM